MKKNFLTLAATLGCFMAAPLLTSCGSDNDSDDIPPTPTLQAVQVVYQVALASASEQYPSFSSYVSSTVTYADADGQQLSETMSSPTWSKTITLKHFPLTASLSTHYEMNGSQPTSEAVRVGDSRTISYNMIMSDGQVKKGVPTTSSSIMTIAASQLGEWITRNNSHTPLTQTFDTQN